MGRISIPFQDLIDDYNNTLERYGRGAGHLANEARKAWCQLRSQVPAAIEQLPGSGFSSGFHDAICSDDDTPNRPPPNEESRPNGTVGRKEGGSGQCNQLYTIYVEKWIITPGFYGGGWRGSVAEYEVRGPINSVSIEPEIENMEGDYADRLRIRVRLIVNGELVTSWGPTAFVESFSHFWWLSDDQCSPSDPTPPDSPQPEPPPPPYWPGPQPPFGGPPDFPGIPQPPPIPLPKPPDWPDIPAPEINLKFNIDNRRFEGDRFDIDIGGPNININWDDHRPPPIFFPDPGVRTPAPLPPPGPIIRPPSGGPPSLPGIPWEILIGELVDRVAPDASDWIEIADILTDIIDTLSDLQPGEDGTKVEATSIPYYDCDSEEFKNLVWRVKRGDVSAEDLNILSEAAQKTKLWCNEPQLVTGIPEWWARRVGANIPQIVVVFRRGDTSSYTSLQIPHYSQEPEKGTTPIGSYNAGSYMARETLTDNSKVVVNASSEEEAERVLDEMCEWVEAGWRYSPPKRQFTRRQGEGVANLIRWPRKVEIYPSGRYPMAAPSKAWRLPIEEQNS